MLAAAHPRPPEAQARRRWLRASCLTAVLWAAATGAAAQQYGASASRERPISARNDEDATAAGTTIDLEHREVPLERMAEVMREVPGARPVVGGGYGTFSSVSLRGSQLGHTVWVLGEVPLNTPDSGAFDMSTLPVPLLSSLEVYRGGAPAWYSQGAIGGVVRVVPNAAETTRLSAAAGGGSFGRYEGRFDSQVITPKLELRTGVGLSHADNDYPFARRNLDYDRNDDAADDDAPFDQRFRNAEISDVSGLLHLTADAGPGQLDLVTLGLERVGGVPGPGSKDNGRDTHRKYLSGLLSLAYTQQRHDADRHRRYRLQVLASVRAENNDFQDPSSEFGLDEAKHQRSMWWRSTLRAAASYSPLDWLEASLIGSFSHDRYDRQDLQGPVEPTSTRSTEALTGELRFMGRLGRSRAELRGSVRLESSQAVLHYEDVADQERETQRVLAPTYRAAALVEAMPGLTVRGSFSTGTRVPSILELFGDGGLVRGNARKLEPERGMSGDLGLVWSGNRGLLAGTLELGGFVQRIEDIIVWRQTGQNQIIAMNDGQALIPGLEVGLSGCLGRHFSIDGAATLLNAENTDKGTQLPRRPRAQLYMRPEVSLFTEVRALSRIGLFATVDYQSTFYHDPANERLQAARTLLGVGTALAGFDERVVFTFRAENVADVRTRDFFNYPLPGRAFSALLTYRQEI